MELAALENALPEIIAAGATLVVISPQLRRAPRETGEEKAFSYNLLRDQGNQLARRYGLVFALPPDLREIYLKLGIDLVKANGDDSWTLPMPARFVVDRGGTVRFADVDPDYTRRSEPARTIEVLKTLPR